MGFSELRVADHYHLGLVVAELDARARVCADEAAHHIIIEFCVLRRHVERKNGTGLSFFFLGAGFQVEITV